LTIASLASTIAAKLLHSIMPNASAMNSSCVSISV
jgi:hypothetical protein